MKCIEPIIGLRIYFDETDQGNFYTTKVAVWSRSEQDKMMKQDKSMATYCGIPLAILYESYMKQQEKLKMTKQEADNKANRNYYSSNSFGMNLINALEALGLLKFEEEKKENTIHEVIRKARNIYSNDVIGNNKFMQDLYDNGYRIVKLGKITKFNEGAISWSIRLDDISQEQS